MKSSKRISKFIYYCFLSLIGVGLMYVSLDIGWWIHFVASTIVTFTCFCYASYWLEIIIKNFGVEIRGAKKCQH